MKLWTKQPPIALFFLVVALLVVPMHEGKSSSPGLVGYWRFNEKSGTIAQDSSGNGRDGIIHGASWTYGIEGSALNFHRESHEYVDAPPLLNLDTFTVLAWVRFDSQSFEHIVATRSSSSPYQFDLWMGATGYKLRLGVYLNSGQVYMTDSEPGTPLAIGVWYHVAGVFDGEKLDTYLNGTLDYSKPAPGSLYTTSPDVVIGGAAYDSNYFDGTIDDVQIYDRALTAEEIQKSARLPPFVTILSPVNKIYNTKTVSLSILVSEDSSWIGYSLDGNTNVTTTGNETLVGLSEGAHSLIAYANDTVGNTGISAGIHFTVDTTAPIVAILSPEYKEYATRTVPLTFIIDEVFSWAAYSLDGAQNVTISGNATLTKLEDGIHSLTVYANDTVENNGASETVTFTVNTRLQPYPGLPFEWLIIVILAVVIAAETTLLLLRRTKLTIKPN